MTEQQAQPAPEPVAPQPQAKVAIDPVQFEQIKKVLEDKLIAIYGEFSKQLHSLPCHPHLKGEAFRQFDLGFLCFKEGVKYLPAELLQVVQQPAPVAPVAAPSDEPAQPDADPIPDGAQT